MRAESRCALGVTLMALIGIGCATPKTTPDTDGARGQAVARTVGERIVDALDCKSGDCADWHRVQTNQRGNLTIDARALNSPEANPLLTIRLEDGFGESVDDLGGITTTSRGFSRKLDPGFYLVGVESPPGSGATPYELNIRLEGAAVAPPRRPKRTTPKRLPPPEPRFERIDAEVLEVEGQMAAPTGVLLDIGRNRGAYRGMAGELLEGSSSVGRIELVDIYDEGSRAKISGTLRRPITPAVRAVLLFPKGEAGD